MGLVQQIGIFLLGSVLAGVANAAVITYDFTATVSDTSLYEPESAQGGRLSLLPIQQGSVISGRFSYDTAAKPASVQPPYVPFYTRVIRYEIPGTNFVSYQVNGFDWASMPSLNARKTDLVRDSDAGYSWDEVQFHTIREEDKITSYALLNYYDWGGDALDDTHFPETFDLAHYFTFNGWFDDLETGSYFAFDADITSLQRVAPSEIPEPTAAFLMLGGAAALASARRRRRAQD
ncbi:PEP-CTERM sorting domain-containing protein [Massilia sp. YIM B02769]|nr:PEP-CTERM sorting domain-containing protein [Massilia sp. YIM B02769]